ncbi:hypothetical protein ACJX0J_010380, partial [Zea mays]
FQVPFTLVQIAPYQVQISNLINTSQRKRTDGTLFIFLQDILFQKLDKKKHAYTIICYITEKLKKYIVDLSNNKRIISNFVMTGHYKAFIINFIQVEKVTFQ